jgi:choline-sulfatase
VDLKTVPRHIADSIRVNRPTPELRDPDKARLRIALYYAAIAQMDDCVGHVLAGLRETGLDRDTIVVYTSDHGEMLAEHGLWQKFVFYEPSVGVPLIVSVPGMTTAGARSKTPVSLVQLLPTLAELCGVSLPTLDGDSFARDVQEPARTRDGTVYAEFSLNTPRPRYMIRRGDYKYCHYTNDIPELYNLREDPAEMRNLAVGSAHAAHVAELKAQLTAWAHI